MPLPEATDDSKPPSAIDDFDDAVDAWFDANLRGKPAVDRALYSVSELADFSLLWHLLAWSRAGVNGTLLPEAVRLSTIMGAESTLVNAGIKSLFKRERPVPEFERPHHLRVPLTSSFPSGHASAAFCAAVVMAEGKRPLTKAAWFGLATVVAGSRIHVKIHHASDVLGGTVVGSLVGLTATRLWRRPTRR